MTTDGPPVPEQRHHGHGHGHGHEFGDDHDDELDDGPDDPRDDPLWQQDNVLLSSVGIDIGSAGTQVVFSRLHLVRLGEELLSRYTVVRRDTTYVSAVRLTPYDDAGIDLERLGELLDEAYASAGVTPAEVETGAVILTGEALRRRNAAPIAAKVSALAGDVVCATAGHHMEAALAAYGSGAARASHDLGAPVLNVDVGGGTTKLAVCAGGRVVGTAALAVGGRLVVVEEGRITRLEPWGRAHAARSGLIWELGDEVGDDELARVAATMASDVVAALAPAGSLTPTVEQLFLTAPLSAYHPAAVMFSGGVAEFVDGDETRDFGDLGRHLGLALRGHVEAGAFPAPVRPSVARIRATVLGAAEYSVQLSGNTGTITAPDSSLPRRNLPVLPLPTSLEASDLRLLVAELEIGLDEDLVVSVRWDGAPEHQRLLRLAEALTTGLAERIAAGRTLYVLIDADIAMTVGAILREELSVATDLVVLDGLLLERFDYVDLGRLRPVSMTVPVSVKSLVFTDVPALAAS